MQRQLEIALSQFSLLCNRVNKGPFAAAADSSHLATRLGEQLSNISNLRRGENELTDFELLDQVSLQGSSPLFLVERQ